MAQRHILEGDGRRSKEQSADERPESDHEDHRAPWHDQPFGAPAAAWTATGGEITPEGLYTARETPGAYRVQAVTAGLDAWAEVRVTTCPAR